LSTIELLVSLLVDWSSDSWPTDPTVSSVNRCRRQIQKGFLSPDIDSLVRRRMYDHLADIAMLGILNRQFRNEGRAGGQYYEYEFTVGLTLVCEVVDTLNGVTLPNRIRHQL